MRVEHVAYVLVAALAVARAAAPSSETPLLVRKELRCDSGLLGGFQRKTLPNSDADYQANVALQHYLHTAEGRYAVQGCQASKAKLQVLDACSQVVAGTRWAVLFQASVPCSGGSGSSRSNAQQQIMVLEALVYQPLPFANQLPQVQEVVRLA